MALSTGRILVMDDEDAVRNIVARMLRYNGNEVDEVSDGEKVLMKYMDAMHSGYPFDVVIMDLNVPGGMGGKEAMNILLRVDPDVKAIISSGYANDHVIVHYQDYGFKGVITKPYHYHKLITVVSEVINET